MYQVKIETMLSVFGALVFSSIAVTAFRGNVRPISAVFFVCWSTIQYFLSPLIAFYAGGWSAYMLRPESADSAIYSAILLVTSVSLGYGAASFCESKAPTRFLSVSQQPDAQRLSAFERTPVSRLLVSSVLLASLEVLFRDGSFGALVWSEANRGEGQFDALTIRDSLSALARGISIALGGYVALVMGIRLGLRGNGSAGVLAACIVATGVGSVALVKDFSRGSGLLFILAALAVSIPRGFNSVKKLYAALLAGIGIWLCVVGITHRSLPQGAASFLVQASSPDMGFLIQLVDPSAEQRIGWASANFFDAIAPASAHIEYSDRSQVSLLGSLVGLLIALQPLPSQVFGVSVRFGASLTEAFGTVGSVGLTTPVLSELVYLFGNGLFFVALIYGILLRRVDLALLRRQSTLRMVPLALIMGGIVVAGHSGIRAFARPTILALAGLWLLDRKIRIGKFTWRV